MSFLDKMKKKADELGLVEKAEHAAKQAREKAGELAAENRDKIDNVVTKAGSAIDQRTEGKYADKITKAKEQIAKGVDKVAEKDPGHGPAGASGVAGAAGTGAGTGFDAAGDPASDTSFDPGANPASASTFDTAAAGQDAAGWPGVEPSSVNPPEVSDPVSGHPAPTAFPDGSESPLDDPSATDPGAESGAESMPPAPKPGEHPSV